jgi:hypothetical protein
MHEHFDGQKAFQHVARLAELRRLPGTPGEPDARDYISGVGHEIGVEMRSERFAYSTIPFSAMLPFLYLVISILCVVGSLTYLWGSSFTAIPGAAILLASCISFKWYEANERFATWVGNKQSANLVGEIKASTGSQGTILLCAHYDSKSQLMPVAVRAMLYLLGFSSATLLGLTLFVVGIMAAAGKDMLGSQVGFHISLVPALLIFALVFNRTGNKSPGALDDASGEAVILEAARVLAQRPLESLDVRVISFGCEEIGLIGSIKYLHAHEEEFKRRPLFMMNFDMPFSPDGDIGLNSGFGIPPHRTSERLNQLSRKAAGEMGFEIKGILLPARASADHMPWSKHGFEATGFVSTSPYMHRSGDSIYRIDREALRRTGEIAMAVVRELDQQVC